MTDGIASELRAEIARLRGRMDGVVLAETPPALRAVAAVRFDGPLVVREHTEVSYPRLRFEPFAAPREGRFFERYAVFGIARSEDAVLWARSDGPSRDPLVCVRDWDEDDDDFEAIEAEGRFFRPLSVVLGRASLEQG